MKKTLLVILLITLWSLNAVCQMSLITVQSGTETTYYTAINPAIANAAPGAKIILPGGTYWFPNITKELHIIGVGYNPNESTVTGPTQIYTFPLEAGSEFSTVTGCEFMNSFVVYNKNYQFFRCKFNSQIVIYNISENITLRECIFIGRFLVQNLTNKVFLYQNIFADEFQVCVDNSIISNNILLKPKTTYQGIFCNLVNSWVINNIILGETESPEFGYFAVERSNSIIMSNIFQAYYEIPETPDEYLNVGKNNIYNVDPASIFVDYSTTGFSYSNDYHLKDDCPGKDYGTDGYDLGIYGTKYPFKDGGLPTIPHYLSSQISTELNSEGKLPVDIKVQAQVK